jgi:hypothetical protein
MDNLKNLRLKIATASFKVLKYPRIMVTDAIEETKTNHFEFQMSLN